MKVWWSLLVLTGVKYLFTSLLRENLMQYPHCYARWPQRLTVETQLTLKLPKNAQGKLKPSGARASEDEPKQWKQGWATKLICLDVSNPKEEELDSVSFGWGVYRELVYLHPSLLLCKSVISSRLWGWPQRLQMRSSG